MYRHTKSLVPIGFGEVQPIETNKTREGRTQNRRVEFHVIQPENNLIPASDSKATTPNEPTELPTPADSKSEAFILPQKNTKTTSSDNPPSNDKVQSTLIQKKTIAPVDSLKIAPAKTLDQTPIPQLQIQAPQALKPAPLAF